MYAYIKGELTEVLEDRITVEAGGVGYEILVPATVFDELPVVGDECKIYTYFHVREDARQLYGFLSRSDKKVFQQLLTVNGVGPKGALDILSALSPEDLQFAILSEDVKAISSAKGIGLKTAKKLILELKDKISLEESFEESIAKKTAKKAKAEEHSVTSDAVEALTALGYSPTEAAKAVRAVQVTEEMDVEAVLKAALKKMSFR
ncbi:MAG: Holliday junction branch migration protein RuvA [Lachnospiraceae bacterium]|nr:Holliday junction branch migration protein RuvA [Lachnospiraceae bacterium]MBQ9562614.1 Holliday junction branch migration protein RuvA [Lachnospiraceae bacterium]MBR0153066.1 Holliday junction branch migration protein RuvA [Lachnospiraceae bacterium]